MTPERLTDEQRQAVLSAVEADKEIWACFEMQNAADQKSKIAKDRLHDAEVAVAKAFGFKLESSVIVLIGGKAYRLCPEIDRLVSVIVVHELPLIQE